MQLLSFKNNLPFIVNLTIVSFSQCFSARVVVRVSRAELESACGASVVRRSTDVVYFTREMLELALTDVYDEFFAVSLTETASVCYDCVNKGCSFMRYLVRNHSHPRRRGSCHNNNNSCSFGGRKQRNGGGN